MFSKMSLRAAIDSGFDVDKAWDFVKNKFTNAVQASTQPQQSTSSTTPVMTSSGKLTQDIKDKTNDFFKTCKDKSEFFDKLKKLEQYLNDCINFNNSSMSNIIVKKWEYQSNKFIEEEKECDILKNDDLSSCLSDDDEDEEE